MSVFSSVNDLPAVAIQEGEMQQISKGENKGITNMVEEIIINCSSFEAYHWVPSSSVPFYV
jgi:hypothetical protein